MSLVTHPLEFSMKIENAVAIVTGANRGLGLAFARELLLSPASDRLASMVESLRGRDK
jgi:NAD(P)-dependent dehydrogenase (short-subunit alcohol dehydrogenase family)